MLFQANSTAKAKANPKATARFQQFRAIAVYLDNPVRRFAALAVLATLAGLVEAITLVAVVSAALAIIEQTDTAELAAGPLSAGAVGIGMLLLVSLVLALAALGLRLVLTRRAVDMQTEAVSSGRVAAFAAHQRAAWSARSQSSLGDLQHLVSTHADRLGLAVNDVNKFISSTFTLLTFILTAVVVSPLFAVAIVGILGLAFLCLQPIRRRVKRRAGAVAAENRAVSSAVAEGSAIGKEAYVYGVGEQLTADFSTTQQRYVDAVRSTIVLRKLTPEVSRSFFFIIIVGGLALANGIDDLNLAAAGGVLLLLMRSITYVQALQSSTLAIAEHAPFISALTDEVDRLEAQRPTGTVNPGVLETLHADHLAFTHDHGATYALRDVSFTLAPGESVGIVGPSGAGKSTLVDLLLGLFSPSSGSLRVNDVAGSDISRDWWTSAVALVDQSPRLPATTVADAIRFHRDGLGDDQVIGAAELAQINDHIESMTDGYDSQLGSGGSGLSGGQRQRMAIARAVAGQPQLIVLDEPTSALDMTSEREVVEALGSLRGHSTLVIISHRPSILKLCDRLIVLTDGEVVADGPTNEIRSTHPYVAAMFDETTFEETP